MMFSNELTWMIHVICVLLREQQKKDALLGENAARLLRL